MTTNALRCYFRSCTEPANERCEGCLRPSCAAHLGEIPLEDGTGSLDMLALLCDACAQEALDSPEAARRIAANVMTYGTDRGRRP